MSEKVYEDRSILIFGGSSGIGLKAVAEFARQGATVYMGTRMPVNFERAKQQLARREKLNVNNLHIYPFYADVRRKREIEESAQEVGLMGGYLTDVVFCQAGGMDVFTERLFAQHLDPISEYTFDIPLEELNRSKRDIVEEKLAAMRRDLATWTAEAMPHAVAVNCQGTFDAIEVLEDTFSGKFKKILVNSTWGYLSGTEGVEIPLLYRPVDRSRAMLRDRLKQKGVVMGVVVASLVTDTQVGKMFNDFFLNLMDPEQRQAVQDSSIQSRDVVQGIKMLLDSEPKNLFVYRKNGEVVFADSLELSAMYTHTYRF